MSEKPPVIPNSNNIITTSDGAVRWKNGEKKRSGETRTAKQYLEDLQKEKDQLSKHTPTSTMEKTPKSKSDKSYGAQDMIDEQKMGKSARNAEFMRREEEIEKASLAREVAKIGKPDKPGFLRRLGRAPVGIAKQVWDKLVFKGYRESKTKHREMMQTIGDDSRMMQELLTARLSTFSSKQVFEDAKKDFNAGVTGYAKKHLDDAGVKKIEKNWSKLGITKENMPTYQAYVASQESFAAKRKELLALTQTLDKSNPEHADIRRRLAKALIENRTRRDLVQKNVEKSMSPWARKTRIEMGRQLAGSVTTYALAGGLGLTGAAVAGVSGAAAGATLLGKFAMPAFFGSRVATDYASHSNTMSREAQKRTVVRNPDGSVASVSSRATSTWNPVSIIMGGVSRTLRESVRGDVTGHRLSASEVQQKLDYITKQGAKDGKTKEQIAVSINQERERIKNLGTLWENRNKQFKDKARANILGYILSTGFMGDRFSNGAVSSWIGNQTGNMLSSIYNSLPAGFQTQLAQNPDCVPSLSDITGVETSQLSEIVEIPFHDFVTPAPEVQDHISLDAMGGSSPEGWGIVNPEFNDADVNRFMGELGLPSDAGSVPDIDTSSYTERIPDFPGVRDGVIDGNLESFTSGDDAGEFERTQQELTGSPQEEAGVTEDSSESSNPSDVEKEDTDEALQGSAYDAGPDGIVGVEPELPDSGPDPYPYMGEFDVAIESPQLSYGYEVQKGDNMWDYFEKETGLSQAEIKRIELMVDKNPELFGWRPGANVHQIWPGDVLNLQAVYDTAIAEGIIEAPASYASDVSNIVESSTVPIETEAPNPSLETDPITEPALEDPLSAISDSTSRLEIDPLSAVSENAREVDPLSAVSADMGTNNSVIEQIAMTTTSESLRSDMQTAIVQLQSMGLDSNVQASARRILEGLQRPELGIDHVIVRNDGGTIGFETSSGSQMNMIQINSETGAIVRDTLGLPAQKNIFARIWKAIRPEFG